MSLRNYVGSISEGSENYGYRNLLKNRRFSKESTALNFCSLYLLLFSGSQMELMDYGWLEDVRRLTLVLLNWKFATPVTPSSHWI